MKGRGREGEREGGKKGEREREREREKGREGGRERERGGRVRERKRETWIMQAKAIPRRRKLKERAPSSTPAFIRVLRKVTLSRFVIT